MYKHAETDVNKAKAQLATILHHQCHARDQKIFTVSTIDRTLKAAYKCKRINLMCIQAKPM